MTWEESWYYFNVFLKQRKLCLHYFPSVQVDGQGYGFPSARWEGGDSWEGFWEVFKIKEEVQNQMKEERCGK